MHTNSVKTTATSDLSATNQFRVMITSFKPKALPIWAIIREQHIDFVFIWFTSFMRDHQERAADQLLTRSCDVKWYSIRTLCTRLTHKHEKNVIGTTGQNYVTLLSDGRTQTTRRRRPQYPLVRRFGDKRLRLRKTTVHPHARTRTLSTRERIVENTSGFADQISSWPSETSIVVSDSHGQSK